MNIKVNLDGGDLGRGIRCSILEFNIVVPHIARLLQGLHDEFNDNSYEKFVYGFELYPTDKNLLFIAMKTLEESFPQNVKFYETDGQKVFDLRGPAGGVVSNLAVYLITANKG